MLWKYVVKYSLGRVGGAGLNGKFMECGTYGPTCKNKRVYQKREKKRSERNEKEKIRTLLFKLNLDLSCTALKCLKACHQFDKTK